MISFDLTRDSREFIQYSDDIKSVIHWVKWSTSGKSHLIGGRCRMHVLVAYDGRRESFRVGSVESVSSLKAKVQGVFRIDIRDGDRKCLVINYQGADLHDAWVLSEVGVHSGVTLRCCFRSELTAKLFVFCAFSSDTIEILEDVDLFKHTVANLRSMITRRTGLPVTTFRLTKRDGTVMYDHYLLEVYDLKLHDTVRLETWDGWNEFLRAAMIGQTSHAMHHVSRTEEGVHKFQMRVALFVAAHHGHMDIASSVLKLGVRSDEPVGEHPAREWCRGSHIESYKAPIHEAAEHGQVSILRLFVFTNSSCVVSRDGNGLTALNVALRNQEREAAMYLFSKQWTSLQLSALSMPLSIYMRLREWCERAKQRVLLVYGPSKSSIRDRKMARLRSRRRAAVSSVYVDGFTNNMMTSKTNHIREQSVTSRSNTLLPRLLGTRTPAVVSHYRERYCAKQVIPPPDDRYSPELMFNLRNTKPRNRSLSRLTTLPDIAINRPNISVSIPNVELPTPDEEGNHSNDTGSVSKVPSNTGNGLSRNSDIVSEISPSERTAVNQMYTTTDNTRLPLPSTIAVTISRSAKSVIRGEKSRAERNRIASMESSISLPDLNSSLSPGRPFYHATTISDDIPRRTIHAFDKLSGRTTWERAIESLTVASAFRDKPWLHQVKLAMDFSENNIRKMNSRSEKEVKKKGRRHGQTSLSVG